MRVLIIGATGFLGRHLLASLNKDSAVVAISAKEYGFDHASKKSVANCLEQTAPDVVVNLGAIASIDPKHQNVIYDINSFAVLRLIENLKLRGFSGKFIQASSAYVYKPTIHLLTEDSLCQPTSHYGCSKLLAEQYALWNDGKFRTYVLRLFNVIGRGQARDFFVPKVVKAFAQKEPEISLGNLSSRRDFLDVRDFVQIVSRIIKVEPEKNRSEILNIASGSSRELNQIVDTLTELTDHRLKINTYDDPSAQELSIQSASIAKVEGLVGKLPKTKLRDTLSWMLIEHGVKID